MQQISFLPGAMTPGERSLIQRALKTLDRHLHEPGVAFTSTHAAREWLILHMAGLEREEFRVLYLNNQNQLIAGETLFTGTINCVFRSIRSRIGIEVRSAIRIHSINRELNFFYRFLTRFFAAFH
ncbi:JAB domain-containing protein, partial [Escherichia coli]|uniref:JAB domain-containing protein n=1 Tax=Escherichia coli TaxID=562 RepID=UPI0024BD9A84